VRKVVRKQYLDRIRPFIGKGVIKILVGMRRVGKSELLMQVRDIIQKQNPASRVVYVNKELRQFDSIKTHQDLNSHIDECAGGPADVVLLDEVQEIEGWEKSVSSYLAEGMDVFITGSNAHLLSSDLATLLSGRYVEFHVYPLSFSEFCELRNSGETDDVLFRLYLKYGGLPGLHAFEFDETPSFQYLDAIYQSILLKDIVKRHQIRNVALLDNVTQFLFDNIGNLFNPSNVSKYLQSQRVTNSLPTVQSHVKYICQAFLAHQVRQFDLKGKRYLESND
jgi:predicted AAA+ superfamily ATPase